MSYSLLRKSVAIERKNKSVACLAPLVFGNATHARPRGLTSECRFAEPRLMLLLQFVAVSGYEMPAVHCTGGGWVRSVSYVCLSVQPALLRCHPADRRHREFVKWWRLCEGGALGRNKSLKQTALAYFDRCPSPPARFIISFVSLVGHRESHVYNILLHGTWSPVPVALRVAPTENGNGNDLHPHFTRFGQFWWLCLRINLPFPRQICIWQS